MEYLYVTIRYKDIVDQDLKVPGNLVIEELIEIIKLALNLSQVNIQNIQAEPLGKLLNKKKTLIDEEILHGALLTLIS